MNRIAIRATSAIGAAIRKTPPVACPYAASTTWAIGAGRVRTSGSEPSPPVEPTPIPARPSAVYVVTWVASTAPSAETPIVPPRVRKNATTELAAPSSLIGTVFCTARTRFCMVIPRPQPTRNM